MNASIYNNEICSLVISAETFFLKHIDEVTQKKNNKNFRISILTFVKASLSASLRLSGEAEENANRRKRGKKRSIFVAHWWVF